MTAWEEQAPEGFEFDFFLAAPEDITQIAAKADGVLASSKAYDKAEGTISTKFGKLGLELKADRIRRADDINESVRVSFSLTDSEDPKHPDLPRTANIVMSGKDSAAVSINKNSPSFFGPVAQHIAVNGLLLAWCMIAQKVTPELLNNSIAGDVLGHTHDRLVDILEKDPNKVVVMLKKELDENKQRGGSKELVDVMTPATILKGIKAKQLGDLDDFRKFETSLKNGYQITITGTVEQITDQDTGEVRNVPVKTIRIKKTNYVKDQERQIAIESVHELQFKGDDPSYTTSCSIIGPMPASQHSKETYFASQRFAASPFNDPEPWQRELLAGDVAFFTAKIAEAMQA